MKFKRKTPRHPTADGGGSTFTPVNQPAEVPQVIDIPSFETLIGKMRAGEFTAETAYKFNDVLTDLTNAYRVAYNGQVEAVSQLSSLQTENAELKQSNLNYFNQIAINQKPVADVGEQAMQEEEQPVVTTMADAVVKDTFSHFARPAGRGLMADGTNNFEEV